MKGHGQVLMCHEIQRVPKTNRTGWKRGVNVSADVMKRRRSGGQRDRQKLPVVWLFVVTVRLFLVSPLFKIYFGLREQWQLWWPVSALVFPSASIIRRTSWVADWLLKGKFCRGCLPLKGKEPVVVLSAQPLSQSSVLLSHSLSLVLSFHVLWHRSFIHHNIPPFIICDMVLNLG